MNNKLYLIPTPIGNMDDISKRMIDTLNYVDIIFCEDTRSTTILMNYLKIKKPLISNHKFNEEKNIDKLIEYLKSGKNVGIVSDRGTPIISDPGFLLTKSAIDNGFEVVAVPGPTAFVSALITSGIQPSPFIFYGFLNSKSSSRKKELEKLKFYKETIIFYEAPHRLLDTIEDMKNILGNNRKISISREITKKYEKNYHGTLGNINIDKNFIRGEFVIVLEGNQEKENFSDISIIEHINLYVEQNLKIMDAIKQVAKDRNMKKNEVYAYYQQNKEKGEL